MSERILTYSKDDLHTSHWIEEIAKSLSAVAKPTHTFVYDKENSFPADMAVFTLEHSPNTILTVRHPLERNESHPDLQYTVVIHGNDTLLFYSSGVEAIEINNDIGIVTFQMNRKLSQTRYQSKATLFWTGTLDLWYKNSEDKESRLTIPNY